MTELAGEADSYSKVAASSSETFFFRFFGDFTSRNGVTCLTKEPSCLDVVQACPQALHWK